LGRDHWPIITLDDGDAVVAATELATGDEELAFITNDANLLHFHAGLVRPQGRNGGGVAGVCLADDAPVVAFGAVSDSSGAYISSVAGASSALPETQTGSAKVTPFAPYPAKGRNTMGVCCQRFLRNEDTLFKAWVGD